MTHTTNIQQTGAASDGLVLEQMRQQLDIMKQKLNRQTIVTDSLIHQAIKQRMSWIDRYMWIASLILLPFICVAGWQAKTLYGLSWYSYTLLVLLSAGCIVADIIINHMKDTDWQRGNLMQTARKLAHMKQVRKRQTTIQTLLLLLTLAFIGYDTYTTHVLPHEQMVVLGVSTLAGLLIGGAIGLAILGRMQRTNDDVIRQINQLTDNDDAMTSEA